MLLRSKGRKEPRTAGVGTSGQAEMHDSPSHSCKDQRGWSRGAREHGQDESGVWGLGGDQNFNLRKTLSVTWFNLFSKGFLSCCYVKNRLQERHRKAKSQLPGPTLLQAERLNSAIWPSARHLLRDRCNWMYRALIPVSGSQHPE